jgi:uncharacterized protein (DUF4415 family)
MRTSHDFSAGTRNPYAKRLTQQITIRLERDVVRYFKALSAETGIPYQNLINLYLRECASESRRPSLRWQPVPPGSSKR